MKEDQAKFEVAEQSAKVPATVPGSGNLFFNVQKFEHAQRVAQVFAKSDMVPAHFKNNVGNCLIAFNYAERVGADPFMVMQGLYVVHGRPGLESKLAIALLNSSGRFTPLKFEYNENKTECVGVATDLKTNQECKGVPVTLEMAKAEGWSTKAGSKWKTMPELMLMYRAAIFFIRMYAPEVLLGIQTKGEIYDAVDLVPSGNGSYAPVGETTPAALSDKIKSAAKDKPNPDPKTKPEQDLMTDHHRDQLKLREKNKPEAYAAGLESAGFAMDPPTTKGDAIACLNAIDEYEAGKK